jgi:hypothetical protein
MIKYTIRRCLQAIPVLILITILLFFMMHAQGNPADRFAQNPKVTTAQIAAFEHRWGLDQPLPIQYCDWLGVCGDKGAINVLPAALGGGDNGILHGDLGCRSWISLPSEPCPPSFSWAPRTSSG